MDNLAKVFWMQHSHTGPVFYPLRDEGFQVWLGTRKLSSHPPSVFFDHIHGKTILNWHSSHHRFPACYARRIDWDACAAALERLPLGRRRWVSKHTSGFCSVGTMLGGKSNPLLRALAATSQRTLGMFGNVKNRLSSLFGPC
jgi:hypothetical protein